MERKENTSFDYPQGGEMTGCHTFSGDELFWKELVTVVSDGVKAAEETGKNEE